MSELKEKLNIREMEADATFSATNSVINMSQRPGHLEKVQQHHRSVSRMSAYFKAAAQGQLDGMSNEKKLLHIYQCMRDVNNSRDDLLFELDKLPNQSVHDKAMLKELLADEEKVLDLLKQNLLPVMARTLNTVCKEPTVIVTALRIVEREEKTDEEARKHEKKTGFKPPETSKEWKAMAYEVLDRAVSTRIKGTQIEEREDDKLLLVRFLELVRQRVLEDLRVVKTLFVPCSTHKYNKLNEYVDLYFSCLSKRLHEAIQDGLEGKEYVSMLVWILNTYKRKKSVGPSDLEERIANLDSFLPETFLNCLQDNYLKNMEKNYTVWMQNTLISKKKKWRSSNPEEPRVDSYLRIAAPVIIFQMVDQNLQVTKTISQELTNSALMLSIEQVIKYGQAYKEAIVEFKQKHFEARSQVPLFTQYMIRITIVNNCLQFIELGSQFEKQYLFKNSHWQLVECFRRLKEVYTLLRNEAGRYLLEEVFLDLDKHFDELFTSGHWLQISLPVDTICATLEEYFQDPNRLVEANFEYIIGKARELVTKRYITAMLSKKMSFKSYEESQSAAKKIFKETEQLRKVFLSYAPTKVDRDDPLDIIIMLSEVLKCEDMISFDLHGIVEKYPDITKDHLHRLLSLRDDLPKSDLKEKLNLITKMSRPKSPSHLSIFSQLVF